MLKIIKLFTLAVFLPVMVACAVVSDKESTSEYLESSAVTAKVKTNLIDTLGTKGFAINVKTYKDEVQLSGFVNSTTLKKRAGDIAVNTIDVKRVRNNLIVR